MHTSVFTHLFIFGHVGHCWEGFSVVVLSGSYRLVVMRALLIVVTSHCRAWALRTWASLVAAPRL